MVGKVSGMKIKTFMEKREKWRIALFNHLIILLIKSGRSVLLEGRRLSTICRETKGGKSNGAKSEKGTR